MANQSSNSSANSKGCGTPQCKVDRPVFDRKMKVLRPRKTNKKTKFL